MCIQNRPIVATSRTESLDQAAAPVCSAVGTQVNQTKSTLHTWNTKGNSKESKRILSSSSVLQDVVRFVDRIRKCKKYGRGIQEGRGQDDGARDMLQYTPLHHRQRP